MLLRHYYPKESALYLWWRFLMSNDRRSISATSAVAANPPLAPVAANTAPAKPSNTNSINYSSADMGGVATNFLGCLAFTYSGMSYLVVVPVCGPRFNKEKDADAAARRYDMATSYHKYQWFPGRTASSLQKEFGRSTTVRVLRPYTAE